MTGYSFVYATTLSGLHLSFATLAGLLCLCLARFLPPSFPSPSLSSPAPLSPSASLIPPSAAPPPAPVPTLPAWEVGRFTLLSNVCVVTTNFALLANSVGFYQISRLAIIPLTCAFEALLHGKAYSPPTLAAVLVVLVGVGVCTVTDVTINTFGLVTAAAGAVSTSLQQIVSVVSGRVATALCPGLIRPAHSDLSPASKSVGELQQRYALGSFDLLIQTAPLQAASLLLLGPAVDYLLTGYNVIHYTLTADATAWILLSCILALLTTVSVYLCIGKFSAVSFQVLGHMKTLAILLLGWAVFKDPLSLKTLLGMLLAVAGMVLYSWAVEREMRARESEGKDEEEGFGGTSDGVAAAGVITPGATAARAVGESVDAASLNETTPLLQAGQASKYGSGINNVA
ncbi:unnamed protein product [Closterium sp. NIES-64]|nr:unnamed protein product [Closterium sp. NIES-64]CAI5970924.1 unnamed protein product [Closterium sp. NIES-64]CAI5988876.1 unnamed protein product [Closterium sp. NIES-64]